MSDRFHITPEDEHQRHGDSASVFNPGCRLCVATWSAHKEIGRLLFERADVGYVGVRHVQGDAHVYVWRLDTQALERLPMRFDLVNHSPTGFEWGYGGSGPAQLAMAMVAHAVDDQSARWLHQHYKGAVVSRLPNDGWSLTRTSVREQCVELARRLT